MLKQVSQDQEPGRRAWGQVWPERRSLAESPVERLVAAFGGNVALCASVVGVSAGTLYRWRGAWKGGLRGEVPSGRKRDILKRCEEAGVELAEADLNTP